MRHLPALRPHLLLWVTLALAWPLSCAAAASLDLTKPASHLPDTDAGSPMVFNAEFRTLAADPDGATGWKTRFFNGDRTLASNNEAEVYSDATLGHDPFSVRDGVLDITASRAPSGSALPFRSGLLTTQTLHTQRYGYFEMRARLPAGRGLWPAFWLLPANGAWPPEIDIVEMLGHEPGVVYDSVHWVASGQKSTTVKVRTADTAASFHIYGLSWHPDQVRWFIDGQEVAHLPTPPGMDQPMYMLVNLAVGAKGSWPGPPADGKTSFPAHMLVDWVRAFAYQDPRRP